MAIHTYTFSTKEEFIAWAAENLVPAYFGATDYDDGRWTGYRDAEKTEPLFAYQFGWTPRLIAWKSASVSRYVDGQAGYSDVMPQIIMSDYGVFIDLPERTCGAIITKSNNGETLTVIGGGASAANWTEVYCTCWGDDVTITDKTQFTAKAGNQTVLVPFASDAAPGQTSYAPAAFYIPEGQYYSLGFSTFWTADGSTLARQYITNGYWALRGA